MLILGIESSCDDTSVCLLDASTTGHTIVALKTASQIDIHKQYGGVVPEVAGRLHAEAIAPLIEEVLSEGARRKAQGESIKPDIIAVTSGPGLITSLLVGVEAARTLSYAWDIPLVAVNHLDGHLHSVELPPVNSPTPYSLLPTPLIKFPALALIVSGGHTELVLLKDHGKYQLLGATVDDAAGECFDKVAKILDLPYPGGPKISKHAETGNPAAINFPRPMLASPKSQRDEGGINEPNYNFSFSGLKTSALYWLRDNPINNEQELQNFCASIEQAIVDVLATKTLRAVDEHKPVQVLLAGGVAANKKLRNTLAEALKQKQIEFLVPDLPFCMDNGAMIAAAGFYKAIKKDFTPWEKLDADSNWKIA